MKNGQLCCDTTKSRTARVCALPFSILTAFILMERCGIAGDLISFGGIAIALGMIIDATIIIMVEKIQTALSEKAGELSVLEIISASAQEVGRPIVFAIAIIVIVFLPIFTLGACRRIRSGS